MNLLGIDAGTSGCKVALFTPVGEQLAAAYREYDAQAPRPGWAQLDAHAVWGEIKAAVREVTTAVPTAAISALAVSSMGEALVPVTADRRILGPSLLNFDARGAEFLPDLAQKLPDDQLYVITGNSLGNHYSLPKLKWIQEYAPELYAEADQFLHWSAFVAFMLGAQTAVDFSLANRSLLFDLREETWSAALLAAAGLDGEKLPPAVPAGTVIGAVSPAMAGELGLPAGVRIVCGAHDQCANAVGSGVVDAGGAVYGMGTYHCITPVFAAPPPADLMIARGLNTEHHAVPGRYVSFLYNQGGSLVKWYRDTFAAAEQKQAQRDGRSPYPALFAEMPEGPGRVLVLPHFAPTGPPDFISDSAGLISGLHLNTSRGEILRGILEGAAFYLKEVVDALPGTGIEIQAFRAAGGGSRSDAWVQTCADIFGRPITRPVITEAGALGAAIIAGAGSGIFDTIAAGSAAMVKLERVFEPDPARHEQYQARFAQYCRLRPLAAALERRRAD